MTWRLSQHPRVGASVPRGLRHAAATVPVQANAAEIGLGGCYVEIKFTNDASAEVEIVLWMGQKKIHARGVVVSSHSQVVNGLKFTHISSEDQAVLKRYVDSLQHAGRLMGIS